jgi:PAS domain S-box-containing protein
MVLLVPFLTLLVLSAAFIGWLSFRSGQRYVGELSGRLLTEINARVIDHLNVFLEEPRRVNAVNADAFSEGILSARDPQALLRHFLHQVQAHPSISSAYFGNARGGLVDAGRESAAGGLYTITTDEFAAGRLVKRAVDSRARPGAVIVTVPSFDARTRPWYAEAAGRGAPGWTEPYVLSTGQDLAISASRPIRNPSGELLGVTSVDIFLSQLGAFMKTLPVGKTGESFIMEPAGLLIASSADAQPFAAEAGGGALQRRAAGFSVSPSVRAAADAISRRVDDLRGLQGGTRLTGFADGARLFIHATSYRSADGLDWVVVAVVPESDFMGPINANTRATLLTVVAAFLIAMGMGIMTARLISRPILRLNQSTKATVNGAWGEPVRDGAPILEIQELTASFNAMIGRLRDAVASLTIEVEERKEAEAAVRTTMEKYRVFFDSLPLGALVTDQTGRILEMNRNAERIFGNDAERGVGQRIDNPGWKILRPDGSLMPPHELATVRALRTGAPVQAQVAHVILPSGRTAWLSVTAAPIPLKGFGITVSVEDITDRKSMEAELAATESKLRHVVEQTTDGVVLVDGQGTIIEWNSAMQAITGFGRLETLGRSVFELQERFPPEARRDSDALARLREALQHGLQPGAFPPSLPGVREVRVSRPDGTEAYFEASIFPIRTDAGNMIGATVRDVTGRKLAERERERLIRELQTALGEVKRLSGLLPICSSCKKIRDDKGYWHQVEVYIKDHTDVDFSHGLCPDCLAEYMRKANLKG